MAKKPVEAVQPVLQTDDQCGGVIARHQERGSGTTDRTSGSEITGGEKPNCKASTRCSGSF